MRPRMRMVEAAMESTMAEAETETTETSTMTPGFENNPYLR